MEKRPESSTIFFSIKLKTQNCKNNNILKVYVGMVNSMFFFKGYLCLSRSLFWRGLAEIEFAITLLKSEYITIDDL